MPNKEHHTILKELTREELMQERGLMIRFMEQMRDEIIALRQEVTILNSKQMAAEEWIEIRRWCRLTGETKAVALKKCNEGFYKTKDRTRSGAKWYIHRSELERHKIAI